MMTFDYDKGDIVIESRAQLLLLNYVYIKLTSFIFIDAVCGIEKNETFVSACRHIKENRIFILSIAGPDQLIMT